MSRPNCLNCDQPITSNYCPYCGQKASTHRFTLNHIFAHDLIHGLVHVDKGILYTAKQLFLRPGYAIREYIEGRRVNHFNYITMLLLLIAVNLFLQSSGAINVEELIQSPAPGLVKKMQYLLQKYMRQFYLVTILISSLGTYVIFRRAKQNYAEHIVMNVYRECGIIMIAIICMLIMLCISNRNLLITINTISGLLVYSYNFRYYYQYFRPNYKNRLLLSLRAFAAQMLVPILGVIAMLIYIYLNQGKVE